MTTTVVLAFCIPLARLVRDIARDQAMGSRSAMRACHRALAVTVGHERVASVIAGTEAGGGGGWASCSPTDRPSRCRGGRRRNRVGAQSDRRYGVQR